MSLDIFKQTLTLSMHSNDISRNKGTQTVLQEALQRQLISALPTLGDWQLVWGPVVWKHEPEDDSTGPDNSWYVAYHPSLLFEDGSVHPTYVIAIAGTPDSRYVWTQQNFAVNSVADFNAWVAGGIQKAPVIVAAKDIVPGVPYIAKGTVNAVHVLLTTAAPEGAASPGMTLIDFAASLDMSDSPRIISTGFSLGGALSPSLALSLVSAGVIPADNTLTYPCAGPSPGNPPFTDLFVATFPARKSEGTLSYQGWNLNWVNTLDVVPQAWCVSKSLSPMQNLSNIPPIYGEPVLSSIQDITNSFGIHASSSGVLYKPIPSQYFVGSAPPAPPSDVNEFLQIAVEQHILGYLGEAGMDLPALSGKSQSLGAGLGRKSEFERRFNYPVIGQFEWARVHPEETRKEIEKDEDSPDAKAFLDGRI